MFSEYSASEPLVELAGSISRTPSKAPLELPGDEWDNTCFGGRCNYGMLRNVSAFEPPDDWRVTVDFLCDGTEIPACGHAGVEEDPGLKIWGVSDPAGDAAADVNSTVFLAKSPYNNAEREMPQGYYATDLCSAEPVDGACFESTLIHRRAKADVEYPAPLAPDVGG